MKKQTSREESLKGSKRDQKQGDPSTGNRNIHVFGRDTKNVSNKNRYYTWSWPGSMNDKSKEEPVRQTKRLLMVQNTPKTFPWKTGSKVKFISAHRQFTGNLTHVNITN